MIPFFIDFTRFCDFNVHPTSTEIHGRHLRKTFLQNFPLQFLKTLSDEFFIFIFEININLRTIFKYFKLSFSFLKYQKLYLVLFENNLFFKVFLIILFLYSLFRIIFTKNFMFGIIFFIKIKIM